MTHLVEALSGRRLLLWAGVLLSSLWLQAGQGLTAAGVLLLLWWTGSLVAVARDWCRLLDAEAELDGRVARWCEASDRLRRERKAAAAAGKDGA